MKIAIFHPWIKSKGGAERVVLELAKEFKADVYTWFFDKDKTFSEFKKVKVFVIGPKILKFDPNSFFKRGLYLLTSLFSKIENIDKYDVFIVSTSGISEFILLRNNPKYTIAYVHTPLRAAFDLYTYYLKEFNVPKKISLLLFATIYRIMDKWLFKKFKVVICNSNETKRRIKKYKLYNGKIFVVHPGVKIPKVNRVKYNNYFFYPSRYTKLKRQDLVIDSFMEFLKYNNKFKLILVGSVRDKEYFRKLKKMECDNIIIKDGVSEKELNKLYKNCFMVLYFPINEDFGIVPLEAMGFGKAVIATNEGGYVDIVKKGFNFLIKSNKEEIVKTLKYCVEHKDTIVKKSIKNIEIVKKYSWKNFKLKIRKVIENEIFINVSKDR